MKTFILNLNKVSSTRAHVLGTLLAISLISPLSVLSQSQAAVNLGSTSNFAVLAGSLVSNIPTSAVTGDIGLSPATGGNVTGFGPNEVTGTIYTVDASGPAGSVPAASRLTTAKGDLTTAFNDAAGRMPVPVGAFLNPGTGNIGGLTLSPGLYKFTSGASITGSNVTLLGNATDVWIFQIASNLTVGNGIQVTLAGGAQTANIFWQVGTSATLGTTSVFKGTILASQSISLNTGARLDGRALAMTAAVTLASNAITVPSSTTAIKKNLASQEFSLLQNYSDLNIEFTVPSNGKATLQLFNTSGRQVATLFNGEAEAGKRNRIQFNTTGLTKGLYFSKLDFNGKAQLEKELLIQ
jgi:hypothetical protein